MISELSFKKFILAKFICVGHIVSLYEMYIPRCNECFRY